MITDLRFAVRALRQNPGFAATVVATLGLGIGASAAIFAVVNAVLLRPLPFKDPDRVVRLFHGHSKMAGGIEGLSPADLFTLREHSRAFDAVATYRVASNAFALIEGDRPEPIYGTFVTADFFKVLGVPPFLGGTFQPGDDSPTAEFRAVISYDFWQRRLQRDPGVIGRPLKLVGMTVPIVGVMPPGFWFPRSDRSELWVIERLGAPSRQGPWFFDGIGRLRTGVTAVEAQPDLEAVAARVREKFPLGAGDWTLVTRPLRDTLLGDMRQALLLLLAAVVVVLTIVCVNVTNLMLARATVRAREIAIRAALGASRSHLIRQLFAESLVLAAIGVVVGLVLARGGVATLIALTPENLHILRDMSIGIDGRVLAFAVAAGAGSALAFGLIPALSGSRFNLSAVMNEAGRAARENRARRRLRGWFVVAEFALTVLLLAGAGLVTRSLIELQGVNAGVRAGHVLTATLTLQPSRIRQQTGSVEFFDRLLADVRALPGVVAASVSYGLPPNGLLDSGNFIVEGQSSPNGEAEPVGDFLNIDGDYFRTLGIPLLSGRTFDTRDTASSPPTVIINDRLARRFFAHDDPVGRKLRVAGDWVATIVGVVGDVKYRGLDVDEELTMYGSFRGTSLRTMSLVVRTTADPVKLVPALRRVVRSLDPELPLGRVRTLQQLMDESIERPRFRTTLFALFAVAALALAAIGIYGVMGYSVTQRRHEMGVRIALGAQVADVVRLVVGEGLRLALAGVGLGLVAALALTRTMSTLLFGVGPMDPLTFLSVTALLVGVALVACWLPARRATRADPVMALRAE